MAEKRVGKIARAPFPFESLRQAILPTLHSPTSNLDAEPHFGRSFERDLEKVRCPARDLGEERKNGERLSPHRGIFFPADDDLMGDVVVHVIECDIEAVRSCVLERPWNVRRLHET